MPRMKPSATLSGIALLLVVAVGLSLPAAAVEPRRPAPEADPPRPPAASTPHEKPEQDRALAALRAQRQQVNQRYVQQSQACNGDSACLAAARETAAAAYKSLDAQEAALVRSRSDSRTPERQRIPAPQGTPEQQAQALAAVRAQRQQVNSSYVLQSRACNGETACLTAARERAAAAYKSLDAQEAALARAHREGRTQPSVPRGSLLNQTK